MRAALEARLQRGGDVKRSRVPSEASGDKIQTEHRSVSLKVSEIHRSSEGTTMAWT